MNGAEALRRAALHCETLNVAKKIYFKFILNIFLFQKQELGMGLNCDRRFAVAKSNHQEPLFTHCSFNGSCG